MVRLHSPRVTTSMSYGCSWPHQQRHRRSGLLWASAKLVSKRLNFSLRSFCWSCNCFGICYRSTGVHPDLKLYIINVNAFFFFFQRGTYINFVFVSKTKYSSALFCLFSCRTAPIPLVAGPLCLPFTSRLHVCSPFCVRHSFFRIYAEDLSFHICRRYILCTGNPEGSGWFSDNTNRKHLYLLSV